MSSLRNTVPAIFGVLLMGTDLWAHPGHGSTTTESVSHYLIEPAHALWLLLLGVGIAAAFLYSRVRKSAEAKVRVRKKSSYGQQG